MSHITKVDGIKFIHRNPIIRACEHMKIEPRFDSRAKLFSTEVAGTVIPLPHWAYPMVIGEDGVGQIDSYGTEEEHLDALKVFKQRYSFECLRDTAQQRGLEIDDLVIGADGRAKVLIGAPPVAASARAAFSATVTPSRNSGTIICRVNLSRPCRLALRNGTSRVIGVSASGVMTGLANGAVQLSWLSLGPLSDSTGGVPGSSGDASAEVTASAYADPDVVALHRAGLDLDIALATTTASRMKNRLLKKMKIPRLQSILIPTQIQLAAVSCLKILFLKILQMQAIQLT